jgi:apolipoprotein N-acyltransferase
MAKRAPKLRVARLAKMGGPVGLVVAVAAGGAMALAYPGVGWWPLAIIAWMPLLAWIRAGKTTPVGAALLGLTMGTVLHAAVFSWIVQTMETMSGLPTVAAVAVMLIYAVAMAVHQALVAYAAALDLRLGLAPRWWWLRVAGFMVASEVLVPFQFPWFLGNAFYQATWLHQAADIIGIVGVSGLAIAVAAAVAQAVVAPARRRGAATAALCVIVVWCGYGAWRVATIDATASARSLRALIVQHNPTLTEKRSEHPAPRVPMFERARAMTRAANREGIDVILWSEGALPFFYVPDEVAAPGQAPIAGRANALLRRITAEADAFAAELAVPFLFGSLRRVDAQWRERTRNSAVLMRPGQPRWVYDKRILVPFGERMPGRDLIPGLAEAIPGVSDIGEGDGDANVVVAGVNVGLSICYEALFADHVFTTLADSDVFVNLTDDVWFGQTNAPELHLMVQSARSVEMRRPLLRATATGISASVDAVGRVTARSGVWKAEVLRVEADVRALNSPFRAFGTWPARILAALSMLGLALAVWLRRRQAAPIA